MKNNYFTFILIACSSYFFSQEIKLSEENLSFNVGSKNAIVVNIPYGVKDMVEKQIRKELKDWNGKYDSGKGEFVSIQGTSKFMGEKAFDAYSKIISESDNSIKVAFAIDLGGAFLTSREHAVQFKAMSERIKDFAKETSLACIEEELDAQNKELSSLEKTQRSLEKDKEDLAKDIEDYKEKIKNAESKTEKNIQDQSKQKEAIKIQADKIAEVEKRKKSIK